MARTAPAPNIPPIPGMCPGIAVLGGGGAGGGAGGKGSKKGKGKKKAGTKKGKKAAKGGKKAGKDSTAKCGKGKGGPKGCSGCAKKASAGEPVDIESGAVFTSEVDMVLPGPIELEFSRVYSTGDLVDRGMGVGWSYSFCWSLTVHGRVVEVVDGTGYQQFFPLPAVGEIVSEGSWSLERTRKGFLLNNSTGFRHDFRELPGNPGRWVLAIVHARANTMIVLRYDARGVLEEIVDSAGRRIAVATDRDGHIRSLSVADPHSGYAIAFATYVYDTHSNLIAVRDADGGEFRYVYDDLHRLVSLQYPSTLTYHYVYDAQGRCIESWGDYPGGVQDPALDPSLPTTLADNATPAKGLHHVKLSFFPDGSREVVSPSEVQSYFADEETGEITKAVGNGGVTTREFDADGNVLAETNRAGATTRYEWDYLGQLISETDTLGNKVTFIRNEYGHVIEMIDAKGGVVRATRNPDGLLTSLTDQAGATTIFALDHRGLTREMIHSNGASVRYEIDAHGNCTAATLPDGATWKWRFDWWGRLRERIDPVGRVTHYRWSDAGYLLSLTERDGSVTSYRYDSMGNPIETIHPDGAVDTRKYSGLNWHYEEIFANGDVVRTLYDREGNIVAVVNERGEVHRYEWSLAGVTRVVGFDGHEENRQLDAMGNLVRYVSGDDTVAITLDPLAQPIAAEYADGSADTYEYDEFGLWTRIVGARCEVRFERDAVGRIVRESVVLDGVETTVENVFTTYGERSSLRTSVGHEVRIERDARTHVVRQVLNQRDVLEFENDPFGKTRALRLPRGGVIYSEWDELTRLARREVITAAAAVSPNEPVLVGKRRPGVVVEKTYRYSERSNLVETTNDRGTTEYRYDPRERLLARTPQHGPPEKFAWDPTSNVFESGGPPRQYGPGNHLEGRGAARFRTDEAGYLLEKAVARGDGSEDIWTYEWGARRTLDAIERPDGTRLEFDYDPLLRRVAKRVLVPTEDATRVVAQATRYVWDYKRLTHEIVESPGANSSVEKTYVYHDEYFHAPIGERTVLVDANGRNEQPWVYYATDWAGTPEELLAADGTVLATIDRTAYGRATITGQVSTSVRFPGQFEDAETGLHYNFMRYYDPDLGRYLSPDPIGLKGGLNGFAYCNNPIDEIDPMGLMGLDWAIGNDPPQNIQSGGSPVTVSPGGPATTNPNPSIGAQKNGWDSQSGGCTERKLLTSLDDPANAAQKKRIQDGETLNMKGEFPPCKKCHKAMKRWAKKNLPPGKGQIDYHFPTNQKITYKNEPQGSYKNGKPKPSQATATASSTAPAGNKQDTAGLVTAYDKDPKKPDGTFPSTQKYETEKGLATNQDNKGGATEWPKPPPS